MPKSKTKDTKIKKKSQPAPLPFMSDVVKNKLIISVLVLVSIVSWSTALVVSTMVDDMDAPVVAFQSGPRANLTASWPQRPSLISTEARRVPFALETLSTPKVLGASTTNTEALSLEEALALDKAGVVMIINRMDGDYKVSDFTVDLYNLSMIAVPGEKVPFDVAMDIFGSGFVVNADGHIITNAHVASTSAAYADLMAEVGTHLYDVYSEELGKLTDKQYDVYSQKIASLYGSDPDILTQKVKDLSLAEIKKYMKANVEENISQALVVVDKSAKDQVLTKGKEFEEIAKAGLPATLMDYDPDFKESGKDVALIQISARNAPALNLGTSQGIKPGVKVTAIGYPYNAQVDESDLFQPTFSQGIISALKEYKGQKVFQLDNKGASGSSGGPVVDDHGNVVGFVTYINGDASLGDEFTYALPVELAQELMDKNKVTNDLGTFGPNLIAGLSQEHDNRCKSAGEYFTAATAEADSHFDAIDSVSKYSQACEDLIASGQSNDGFVDNFLMFFKNHRTNALIFSGLLLMIIGFATWVIMHILKRRHHPENIVPNLPVAPTI